MLSLPHMQPLYLAADHRGLTLKDALLPFLETQGFTVHDLTPPPNTEGMIDYPIVGQAVAQAVAKNSAIGILICGSGVGVAIAANRFKGIRAADAHTPQEIATVKEHDFINIVSLGADSLSPDQAKAILTAWLTTKEDHAERRVRRAHQLDEYGS